MASKSASSQGLGGDAPENLSHHKLRADGLTLESPLLVPKKKVIYDKLNVREALSLVIDVQGLRWVDAHCPASVQGEHKPCC